MSDMIDVESGDGVEASDADDVQLAEAPPLVAIISHAGDRRPEETEADMMGMFFLDQGTSVTSYVCVPDFAKDDFFLAKHKNEDKKEYVKKTVPSTACSKGIHKLVKAAYRVMGYLVGTSDFKICYNLATLRHHPLD